METGSGPEPIHVDDNAVPYRRVVEISPDIIWINRDNRIVFMNEAGLRLFGAASAEQILGREVYELFHPDSHALVRSRIAKLLSAPNQRVPFVDERIVRLDGEIRDVEATAASFVDAGGIAILSMLRDVTERKRGESALVESHRELRALAAALESIREEERKRLSRDLHDELGQLLSALALDVELLKRTLGAHDKELLSHAEEMGRLVSTTVAAVRRIAKDLRPPMLDTMGLVPALEAMAAEMSERYGPRCFLRAECDDLDLSDDIATQVFRMVQEALANVVKHAQARTARISLSRSECGVVVRVEDDGRGMPPADQRRPGGCGLIGMRERAFTLGGKFAVRSEPGAGTTVEFVLPLAPVREDGAGAGDGYSLEGGNR